MKQPSRKTSSKACNNKKQVRKLVIKKKTVVKKSKYNLNEIIQYINETTIKEAKNNE